MFMLTEAVPSSSVNCWIGGGGNGKRGNWRWQPWDAPVGLTIIVGA